MLKTSGLLHSDDRQDELKQVEVYKSHSKFMKTKVECLCPPPACPEWCTFTSKHQTQLHENLLCACCVSPLHAHVEASVMILLIPDGMLQYVVSFGCSVEALSFQYCMDTKLFYILKTQSSHFLFYSNEILAGLTHESLGSFQFDSIQVQRAMMR